MMELYQKKIDWGGELGFHSDYHGVSSTYEGTVGGRMVM